MGAKQSQELSLAEKRYKIHSPKGRKANLNDGSQGNLRPTPNTKTSNHRNRAHPRPPGVESELGRSPSPANHCNANQTCSETHLEPLTPSGEEIMNKAQKCLIESSWKRARKTGADNVGAKIFVLILAAEPEVKMIFGLEKVPQGRLKYDPRFRRHAATFTKTFDYVVKNLGFPDKLMQHFQSLGRKHVSFQSRGFQPHYWEVFFECMTQTAIEWEQGRKCRETMVAWRILVGFIIKQMRVGYDRERAMRKRFSSSTTSIPCTTRANNGNSHRPLTARNSSEHEDLLNAAHCGERSASCASDVGRCLNNELAKLSVRPGPAHPHDQSRSSSTCDFFTPPSTRRRTPEHDVERFAPNKTVRCPMY